jgi:hypothetical protein
MNAPIIIAPVRKSVRVKAPVARAFDVFTSGLGVLQIARRWNSAADLPDVSKCLRGIAQSIHASDTMLLCMGLFSIF